MSRSSIFFASLLLAGVLASVFSSAPVFAQNPAPAAKVPIVNYNPQVPIPGTSKEAQALQRNQPVSENLLGQYVVTVYRFGVWLAISLAIFMMMVGGFLWVVAGGNPSRVENAKSYITAALTGLVVALTSFLLLQTVNPDLVIFKSLQVERLTNLAGPPKPATLAESNYGCPAGLVVDNPISKCEQACQGIGGGGALKKEGTSQPYAPEIPKSNGTKFCCACEKVVCQQEGKGCQLTGGAPCCTPLVCNTDPNTCLPPQPGEGPCEPGQDWACLSGQCYDRGGFLGAYDYCVPEGGFDDGHECQLGQDIQCKPGSVCGLRLTFVECHRPFPAGEFCSENRDCMSKACDLSKHRCL